MTGYIYYISNAVNDKLYVGKTTYSLKKRFQGHCRDSRKTHREHRPLYRAMKKYGEDKFSIHLLEEVDVEQLEEREAYWIAKLNTYHNGYNATRGGDGKILYNKEFEEKVVADFQEGLTVLEIAEKYHCDHNTVRKRLRARGVNTRENIVARQRISVSQYDLDDNFIQSFDSLDHAATWLIAQGSKCGRLGLMSHIGDVIRGKRKTCCGYIWKRVN